MLASAGEARAAESLESKLRTGRSRKCGAAFILGDAVLNLEDEGEATTVGEAAPPALLGEGGPLRGEETLVGDPTGEWMLEWGFLGNCRESLGMGLEPVGGLLAATFAPAPGFLRAAEGLLRERGGDSKGDLFATGDEDAPIVTSAPSSNRCFWRGERALPCEGTCWGAEPAGFGTPVGVLGGSFLVGPAIPGGPFREIFGEPA